MQQKFLATQPLFERFFMNDHEEEPTNEIDIYLDENGLKESIQRELYLLLNTRCCLNSQEIALYETSEYAFPLLYGIKDFGTLDNPKAVQDFVAHIRKAITRFEPRIHKPQVSLFKGKSNDRELHLKIDGLIKSHEGTKRISFPLIVDKN